MSILLPNSTLSDTKPEIFKTRDAVFSRSLNEFSSYGLAWPWYEQSKNTISPRFA